MNAAVGWFQKSAQQGYTKAMINLGAVYEEAARAARQGK
jgi:TPR repeat protein